MSAAAGLVLLIAARLSAGAVVDVSAGSEGRASFVGAEDGGTSSIFTLALQPGLRAAIEREGAAADVAYTPQLSLVTPSEDGLLLLHSLALGAETPLSHRLRVRARAVGAIGDLDPGTAQRELFASLGTVDASQALSYASGNVEAALLARITRTLNLDIIAGVTGTGSPVPDGSTLPSVHGEFIGERTTVLLSRRDALLLDATVRSNTIVNSGLHGDARVTGVLGAAGWRRQLLHGAALEARGGAFAAVADAGDGRGRVLFVLPAVDGRAEASLDLGGGAALEADGTVGLLPTSDPFGAVLENRLSGLLGLGVRFDRALSLRGAAFGAVPLFAFGGRAPASAGAGASTALSWAFVENAAVTVGAQVQNRLLAPEAGRGATLSIDVTVAAGISGTFTAFHSGGRPRGSDARPGRSLGEQGIGRAAAPHQEIEIVQPPPEPEEEEPEELPPELVPPPVQPPIDITPSDPKKKRRPTTPARSPAAPATTNSHDVDDVNGVGARGSSDGGKNDAEASEKKP